MKPQHLAASPKAGSWSMAHSHCTLKFKSVFFEKSGKV